MEEIKEKLLGIFIKSFKDHSGKGPRNAYIKYESDTYDINFWVTRSPFEDVIINHLGEEELNSLYQKIHEKRVKIIEEHFSLQMERKVEVVSFISDAKNSKFNIIVKIPK